MQRAGDAHHGLGLMGVAGSAANFQLPSARSLFVQGRYRLAYFVADGQPFAKVMGALMSFSNSIDVEEVWCLLAPANYRLL